MKKKKYLLVAATLVCSMLAPVAVYAVDPDPVAVEETADDTTTTADPTVDEPATTAEPTAAKITYVIEDLELKSTTTTIKGKLPVFKEVSDKAFSDKINGIVDTFFNATLKKAEAAKKEVTFSYDVKGDEKYLSVVLRGVVADDKVLNEDVTTLVMDKTEYKLYTLTDILGPSAYKVVDAYINAQIDSKKADYLTGEAGFKGVTATTDFYMDKDSLLTILFDKDEIAPTAAFFTLNLKDYVNIGLPEAEYYKNDNGIMLPLRKVAEDFRYTVEWDAETSTAYIISGAVKYPVNAGVKEYTEYSLTSAPELKDDRLFVPIAFADVLGIAQDTTKSTIDLAKLFYTVAAPVETAEPEATEGEKTEGTETEGEKTEEAATDLSVKGEIVEYTGTSLTIRAESGFTLTFSVVNVDVTGVTNFTIGYKVEVFYTGKIQNEFTNEAVVVRVVSL